MSRHPDSCAPNEAWRDNEKAREARDPVTSPPKRGDGSGRVTVCENCWSVIRPEDEGACRCPFRNEEPRVRTFIPEDSDQGARLRELADRFEADAKAIYADIRPGDQFERGQQVAFDEAASRLRAALSESSPGVEREEQPRAQKCPTCGSSDPATQIDCSCVWCRQHPGVNKGCPDPWHGHTEDTEEER